MKCVKIISKDKDGEKIKPVIEIIAILILVNFMQINFNENFIARLVFKVNST